MQFSVTENRDLRQVPVVAFLVGSLERGRHLCKAHLWVRVVPHGILKQRVCMFPRAFCESLLYTQPVFC